jgi:predicted nucleic acid-binding protein
LARLIGPVPVRVFFDTSVLVAASVAAHPHHARALPLLSRALQGQDQGLVGMHSLAETFSALTRVPVSPRIHPSEANRIIRLNILACCEPVAAEQEDYLWAIATVEKLGLGGGKVYDALLLACAAKSDVERIYTFNLADFKALAPSEILGRVCAP